MQGQGWCGVEAARAHRFRMSEIGLRFDEIRWGSKRGGHFQNIIIVFEVPCQRMRSIGVKRVSGVVLPALP